ncbi:uncharacterized protein LOC126368839 [Pectinophora gossypiella]|uniref:uncharacterized protein LOC126368839 n=1 Tax=Pectinophora gossypiella TaxID=13191 RepID=UPI00214E918E|nr:uncharacterized protein LOC126368839 [Pectinophora gossypiella]
MSSNLGILTVFDHNVHQWNTYKSRLRQWYIANDITNTNDAAGTKRRAVLLSALTEGTYKLAADLALPKDLQEIPYEDILTLLDNHFTPKRLGFGERHNFYAATQQPGETHTQWAARLRGLTAHCSFNNVEEALRDRFIMGMAPGLEKEKLYALDITQLTLAKAVEQAETVRCARAGAAAAANPATMPEQLFKIEKSDKSKASAGKVKCAVCGYNNHKSNECRFANYVCKRCNTKGHLRRMCPNKINYVNTGAGDESDDDVYAN